MKSITIYLLFIMSVSQLFSQQTTISGNAKSYACDTLVLSVYRDMISKQKNIIAKTFVDTSGDFTFTLTPFQTEMYMLELNVFEGVIFAEPDKNYQVILPKKTLKEKEDELNPYFQVQKFYMKPIDTLKIKNDELNECIMKLDEYSDRVLAMLFQNFTGAINPQKTEKVLKAVSDSFPNVTGSYFREYKHYQYALIRHITYVHDKRRLVKEYFADSAVLYTNPAYETAFEKIIDNYFENIASKELSNSVTEALKERKSWVELNKIAEKDELLKKEQFREYVILKSLFKDFYSNNYLKNEIIDMMSSAAKSSNIELHREIAREFVEKRGKLLLGNISPNFELDDAIQETYTLESFTGKFVYLNFFEFENSACEKEITALADLYQKKIDLLEIVTLWSGGTEQDMEFFIKRADLSWTFLYIPETSQVLEDYNVKAFPTYYLIHPEGTLLMLPAPGPAEEFESRYYQEYSKWKRELQRRQNDKTTIKN